MVDRADALLVEANKDLRDPQSTAQATRVAGTIQFARGHVARRCHGLVSGHTSPVQTFTASDVEPTACNFSSARRVLYVKGVSSQTCCRSRARHQDLVLSRRDRVVTLMAVGLC